MRPSSAYQQLWGIVEGAVDDAIKTHPDYLTPKGRASARASSVKRVTGTVLSFAEESAKGLLAQADKGTDAATPDPALSIKVDDASAGPSLGQPQISIDPHCRIGKIKPKRYSRHRSVLFPTKTLQLRRELMFGVFGRMGTGYWARSMHEPVLIGSIGKPGKFSAFPSLFDGVAREHSRKPEEFYSLVHKHTTGIRRADLFARQSRPGFEAWGDEAAKFDGVAA